MQIRWEPLQQSVASLKANVWVSETIAIYDLSLSLFLFGTYRPPPYPTMLLVANKEHFGTSHFVHYREVVLFSEV